MKRLRALKSMMRSTIAPLMLHALHTTHCSFQPALGVDKKLADVTTWSPSLTPSMTSIQLTSSGGTKPRRSATLAFRRRDE